MSEQTSLRNRQRLMTHPPTTSQSLYVMRKIREESVQRWQDRYDSSSTGSITKTFRPNIADAYRLARKVKWSPTHVQILTGHGGISEYLHRFKLKEDPGCESDPQERETMWHILLACPRFSAARHNHESQLDLPLELPNLHVLLAE